ncbi:MAG: hypothetical protein ACJAXX_001353 [Roseivirga sp.]|jgi:hypothetical protein
MKKVLFGMFSLFVISSCESGKKTLVIDPIVMHNTMQQITDVIVHDIFSPPVASRIYAYASIASYEVMAQNDPQYVSLAGQLKGLTAVPKPGQEISHDLAAIQAAITVGTQFIFSEEKMEVFKEELYLELKNGIDKSFFEASIAYGDQVAQHIIDWSSGDNYNQTRTFQKFSVRDEEGRWQPTPPGYMEAIEPSWNKIRTFAIESADQFTPILPTPFDMTKGSQFYKELVEVYEISQNLTEEQNEIASFWDCNPYVLNQTGHVMIAAKKVTPGGHWIGIVKIAAQKAKADLAKSTHAYALTSIALSDAFISCWDEKYRSNLIRPETLINQYIDENWLPKLQTPPFPEYTSGHSVISNAAAIVLTSIFGEGFSFHDDSEEKYGLPPRDFTSFIQASEEAAISRIYGGIHYRPAVENGVTQGRALGNYVVDKIKMTNTELAVNEK